MLHETADGLPAIAGPAIRSLGLLALAAALAVLLPDARPTTANAQAPGGEPPTGEASGHQATSVDSATSQPSAEATEQLWYGVIKTPMQHLRTVIELQQDAEGKWKGSSISLDQQGARIAIDEVLISAEGMELKMPKVDAIFKGTFAGERCTGSFVQAGVTLELVLERVSSIPTEPEAEETWSGTLDAGVAKLELQFRWLEEVDAQAGAQSQPPRTAILDSLSQNAGGFAGTVTDVDGKITMDFPILKAKFEGTREVGGTSIVGSWSQGQGALPLTLDRRAVPVDLSSIKPNRPQTPQSPFPYTEQEVSIDNAAAPGVTLKGTLTLPAGEAPCAAIVIVSGSGPQDRDETILGHKLFAVLADAWARRGVATLRYDDRGVGQSTGDFATATTDDFASDAWAAVQWLRSQARIDPKRVGIGGHSEGALVSSILAADHPDIAFALLLAGPGVDGLQVIKSQSVAIAMTGNLDWSETQRKALQESTKTLMDSVCELLLRQPLPKADAYEPAIEAMVASLTAVGKPPSDDALNGLRKSIEQLSDPWFQRFIRIDPAPYLNRIDSIPLLAIFGDQDVQVLEEVNLVPMRQALADNPNAQVELVRGINHLLQPSPDRDLSRYAAIETTIDPALLQRLTDWLAQR
jgi:uncharacterized protein